MTVSEATASGNIEAVCHLLTNGGDPNEAETDEFWPPLLLAAYEDHAEIARLLLDAGADMYAPHSGGETPLLVAAQRGSLGVFRLLVERGYKMDAARDNAPWMLIRGAEDGSLEILKWLLTQGVGVDVTDFNGYQGELTPIRCAQPASRRAFATVQMYTLGSSSTAIEAPGWTIRWST